jgi:hypothetical protein
MFTSVAKPMGKVPRRKGLHGVAEHEDSCRWVQGVAQDGDEEDEGEEQGVEDEECDAEEAEGCGVTGVKGREGAEQDGDDACGHYCGELRGLLEEFEGVGVGRT